MKMNKVLNELKENPYDVEKWNEMGFLTNLNGEEKEKCLASFGYACEYIDRFIDKIHVVIFPIIKRLIKDGYDKHLPIRKLINTILDVYEEFSFCTEGHEDMDVEVCEEVIERIKKEVK